MYQIPGKAINVRLTEDERTQLNEFAEFWQAAEGTKFTNPKQVVFALLSHISDLEEKVKELEPALEEANSKLATLESELATTGSNREIVDKLIQEIGYQETPSDEKLFSDIVEIINTTLEPAPPVEVEKIVEVEKPLAENEVLVTMTLEQKKLLATIARWRYQSKIDQELLTPSDVMRKMTFNKGSLTNWHGEFETGISESRLKKQEA